MTKNPTLADVARECGVSPATVSRALNTPEKVSAATREAVRRMADALGYAPNIGARALVANRSFAVGVVLPTIGNVVFAAFAQELEQELASGGVSLLVATSGDDPRREREHVRSFIGRGVDGVVLVGSARDDAVYDFLRQRRAPFVVAWPDEADCAFATVGFDAAAAMRDLAERVFSLGHTRLAFITTTTRPFARAAALEAAARARGLCVEIAPSAHSIGGGEAVARQLLSTAPRPTALICADDILAAGALSAARGLGLSAPRDVSIVGFDDLDFAPVLAAPLTTVRTPFRLMGQAAAKLLLRDQSSSDVAERIRFDATIVERASLGPAPA